MPTRQDVAEALQNGELLECMVLDQGRRIICRGMVKWEGTVFSARCDGIATEIRIDYKGGQLAAPLVDPVPLKMGQDCQLEFGPKWRTK